MQKDWKNYKNFPGLPTHPKRKAKKMSALCETLPTYGYGTFAFFTDAPNKVCNAWPNSYIMMTYTIDYYRGVPGHLYIKELAPHAFVAGSTTGSKDRNYGNTISLTPSATKETPKDPITPVQRGVATLVDGTVRLPIRTDRYKSVVCSYKTVGDYPGHLYVHDIVSQSPYPSQIGFSISSTSTLDTSEVSWAIFPYIGITPTNPVGLMPGTATLQNGEVVVPYPTITDTTTVLVSRRSLNGEPGFLSVPRIAAGTGFCISSTSPTDNGQVDWFVVPDLPYPSELKEGV